MNSSDYLITGIPRSGTSLLCRLLDDQCDSVVINEPPETIEAVALEKYSAAVHKLHVRIRADVVAGHQIRNKVTDGRVRTDTMGANESVLYRPAVETTKFLLGTKDTLQYLSRLEELRCDPGGMRVVACIRDPLRTITSWKKAFRHLATADVDWLVRVKALGTAVRADTKNLEEMARTRDVRARRAQLWRHLAGILSRNREWIEIIRYEDLVMDTRMVLGNLLALLDPTRKRVVVVETPIHHDRKSMPLDEAEVRIVSNICAETALEYGYRLPQP